MPIYLGIDGGGSKTTCWVGDETSVLGRGRAGASNVVRVGETRTRESLQVAIREACAEANVSPRDIQRTCAGMSGGARPETSEAVHRLVRECVAGEVEVVGDHITAFEAAFGQRAGVLVIAGTGSIAQGRNAKGETARVGGWGFAISDEGSGHWIGRAVVSSAIRARDLGDSPKIMEEVMRLWGVSGHEQLVLVANAKPDFAGLVPMIVAAAETGDPLAGDVLTQAGKELAEVGRIVAARLFAIGEIVPVAMSGGVLRHCALVRQAFYNGLKASVSMACVNETVVDPVLGALQLARSRTTEQGSPAPRDHDVR